MMFFRFCSVIFVIGVVAPTAYGWSNNEHTIVSQRTRVSRIPPSLLRVGKRIEDSSGKNDEPDLKRSPKFIMFPRVGRTGLETWRIERVDKLDGSGLQKRGEDPKNGLWFGPRLGRFVDNNNAPIDVPWLYTLLDDDRLQKLQKHQYVNEDQQQDRDSTEVVTPKSDNESLENGSAVKENSIQYYDGNV